jgi:hypothetical protein
MPPTTVTGSRYDNTFNTKPHTVSAAAYTTSGQWPVTQGCCKRVLFTFLFIQMVVVVVGGEEAYASEGNLEQTTNSTRNTQTLNQGSDFVKVNRFSFPKRG